MSETLFNTETTGEGNDHLTKVIEARGEEWNDPNVLAKGYLSAQEHIDRIEAENAELREKSSKNDYMKEVLDRIEEGKTKPTGGESSSSSTSTNGSDNQGVTVEQIKSLVAETLTEAEAQRTSSENIKETKRLLAENFGTEAHNVLSARAKELNMSEERMNQLAAESPNAFMQLMGKPIGKESNSLTTGSKNTEGNLNNSSVRNWSYYQKIRRENPQLYRSTKIQNQMLADREAMSSEEFYG